MTNANTDATTNEKPNAEKMPNAPREANGIRKSTLVPIARFCHRYKSARRIAKNETPEIETIEKAERNNRNRAT